MTNAKSRLVRVIALALAVLMIVPMALVGCKKTDDTPAVDQAAIDAAIKEALDAAQKAQDAADKAAQDAKDAQDKLAASEKEAADLQAQIDAMKNTTTTAAPATTTKAPVAEDSKVVDAYIASVVLDGESDFNKLIAKYNAMKAAYLGADTNPVSADAKAIVDAIDTAKIAIQRAPSVDYVNALIAELAANLDAIPTISERVKAAYDAIDFASDEDIVDVAYANAILAKANALLGLATSSVAEIKDFFDAEKKALKAYGDDKLDLATLIADEFDRYAGTDGLYEDVFAYANKADLVAKIQALFNNDAELDVEEIVYGTAANEDAIEAIEDLYDEFYKLYKKEYAALQDAFEIAVIGADYLLKAEGNFLKDKLAAAKARVAELEAAKAEFDATKIFTNKNTGIAALVKAYNDNYAKTTATAFLFNAKTNAKIVAIDEALVAWMAKYGFDAEDENLGAIIGDGNYEGFVEIKAVMNFVNEWAAKLDAIKASDIEDALDALKDTDARIDYAEQGAAVKALYTWYNGTYKEDKTTKKLVSNNDGVLAAELKLTLADGSEKKIAIDTANIKDMLDDALEITVADVTKLSGALEVFEGVKLSGKDASDKPAILAQVKAINKAADKLDLDALKVEDLTAVAEIVKSIDDICQLLKLEKDEDAEFKYATDSKNYGVVPFETLAALNNAKEALVGDLLAKAAEIVKAYIAWKGVYDEDEEAVAFDVVIDGKKVTKCFDIEKNDITVFSYPLVSTLAADYNAIKVFDLTDKLVIEDIEEDEIEFTTKQVVEFYRQINDYFYYSIMEKVHDVAYAVYASTHVNSAIAASNEWMSYGAATTATLDEYKAAYGQYGLKYVFPTSSSNKGTGNDINVYVTKTGVGDDTKTYIKAIEDVDAHKYAVKNGDGLTIGFDVAGYKAAVDANIASYRATWYAKYLAKTSNATTINTLYDKVIKNAIAYGFWTIEGEFEMDDEAYTFVVNADMSVTVKDDADEEIALVKGLDKDEKEAEYKLFAEFENNKVVIKAENLKKLIKAAVVDDPATTDVDETAPAVYEIVNLADVDDAITSDAPAYAYVLADGLAEIAANGKTVGTIKKADHATNTYNVYNEKNLTALNNAFNTNQFYVYRDSVIDDADDLRTGATNVDKLVNEFVAAWKEVKHDKVTKAEIETAYKALVSQVNNLAVAQ